MRILCLPLFLLLFALLFSFRVPFYTLFHLSSFRPIFPFVPYTLFLLSSPLLFSSLLFTISSPFSLIHFPTNFFFLFRVMSYYVLSCPVLSITSVIELDRASVYRYPGNYARYLEMKEARIAADDADADRAKTKLRRESLWMAKQPR